jgi:mannitol-1-/sugar-/sorbitol-6-/2-deoxyglucose-6-phosphatase
LNRPGSGGIDAVIFDMDGLLVDSEPLWHIAEIDILGRLGVPIEASGCRQTKGMFVREVTEYWHERYPWEAPSPDAVAVAIVDRVMQLVVEVGALKPGASAAVEWCGRRGVPLAVASSSEYRLIDLVLTHFDLSGAFALVHSAEDEPAGKPHPAVFLTAAHKLGVDPTRCVVFEDSPAGVIAAKAARMSVVAVPELEERSKPAFAIADAVLDSLDQVDEALWDRLAAATS